MFINEIPEAKRIYVGKIGLPVAMNPNGEIFLSRNPGVKLPTVTIEGHKMCKLTMGTKTFFLCVDYYKEKLFGERKRISLSEVLQ